MIGALVCLAALTAAPQDTGTLDVPVYRNERFGIALPRPFDDWVFSPGREGATITVLFHPRSASLRGQFWGALALTSLDGPVPLADIADQRVRGEWVPALGRTFTLLARDSISLAGVPAIHVVMAGTVNRLEVDVEEYYLARGSDLIVLQLRMPSGLRRDSIAAGYQRTVDGLSIRRTPTETAPATPAAPAVESPDPSRRDAAANRALRASPWAPRAYDALVRFEPSLPRLEFAVRVEAVNGGVAPQDSLTAALRWPFVFDSARSATGRRLPLVDEGLAVVALPQGVQPGGVAAVTLFYHLEETSDPRSSGVHLSSAGARCVEDWLPRLVPWADSAGSPARQSPSRGSVRFDVPAAFTAVGTGRLAAELTAAGRRRVTWVADQDIGPRPSFAVGRLRRAAVHSSSLVTTRVWVLEDAATPTRGAELLAEAAQRAWAFFSGAFGRLPVEDFHLVLADGFDEEVTGGTAFLSASATPEVVPAAVARAWWGGAVRIAGPDAAWLEDALAAWSALAYHSAIAGDSARQRLVRGAEASRQPVAALEAARRAIGDADFRSALRRFFLEHRGSWPTLGDFLHLLGPVGSASVRAHSPAP